MKKTKVKLLGIMALAAAAAFTVCLSAGCGEEEPPPAATHEHTLSADTEYYVRDGALYSADICTECGERLNEEAVENGVIATPETAQEALDKLTDGGVVYFSSGEYTTQLELRQNKYTTSVKDRDNETGVAIDDVQKTGVYHYYRTLKNAVLAADDDAVFTGTLYSATGHVYGSDNNQPYDAVRDVTLTDTNTSYYSHMTIGNLTITGMNFRGASGVMNFAYYYEQTGINGLTVRDCTFDINDEEQGTSPAIRIATDLGGIYSDITVKDCLTDGYFQGVYIQNVNNITVTGNTVKNAGHNAFAIQSATSYTATGKIVISGNTVENDSDRAIRFGNLSDAEVEITDNTFINVNTSEKEIAKGGTVSDVTVTVRNNTVDGKQLSELNSEAVHDEWTVSYS